MNAVWIVCRCDFAFCDDSLLEDQTAGIDTLVDTPVDTPVVPAVAAVTHRVPPVSVMIVASNENARSLPSIMTPLLHVAAA